MHSNYLSALIDVKGGVKGEETSLVSDVTDEGGPGVVEVNSAKFHKNKTNWLLAKK